MRERTPSADDTPKRAPPAPPGEADVAVSKATDVASAAACGASKMVASTHNLDDLGVNHITSASQEHQNHYHHHHHPHHPQQLHQQVTDKSQHQQQHSHPYGRSAPSTQDKRSRLSNVINNLLKKVPPDSTKCDSSAIKEESNRSKVEHKLDTLEKYVMTVLNGVIEDEEKNSKKQDQEPDKTTKEPIEDVLKDVSTNGSAIAVPSRDEDAFSFEPSEANENKLDAAVPCVELLINKEHSKPKEVHKKNNLESRETKVKEPSILVLEEKGTIDGCQMRTRNQKKEESEESPKTLGAIILDRLVDRHQDQSSSPNIVDVELRTICKDLLNDLLNDIVQKSDKKDPAILEKDFVSTLDSSKQSLHCSLPLDKVASVLQICQTPNSSISALSKNGLSSKSFVKLTPSTPIKEQKSYIKLTSPTVRHLCLYCDRKFLSILLRQRHTERVHQASGGRRSERNPRKSTKQNCQYCVDKCVENLESLFQHMVGSHSDKYHGCLHCSTRYLTRDALTSHIHEFHSLVTVQMEKLKEPISTSIKDIKPVVDVALNTKEELNHSSNYFGIKQLLTKDQPSNPGSPEFDTTFYSSVSCNIRENLLHHIDGKLQAPSSTVVSSSSQLSSPATQSLVASPESGGKTPQYQLPIDISLTAVTPVYSKDYQTAPEEYKNSSEFAGKPGKSCSRSYPRRVSFEKYNFPRKYDGKEQWSCSIKDLSKFDISTQLTLRKKQQQIKECTILNRLMEVKSFSEINQRTEDEKSSVVFSDQNDVIDKVVVNVQASANENKVAESVQNKEVAVISDGEGGESEKNDIKECVKTSTVFSSEFESFMRLRKWGEGKNHKKSHTTVYAELTGEWSRPRIYICGACAERYVTLKELEEHKSSAHPNVWCMHFEFSGDQRELYKHLVFLPGRCLSPSPSMKTRLQTINSQSPERTCTKCSKSYTSLSELHRHMLECGGDQAWLLGLFGNNKKKCKWRPFGSRSRRRRQRGMKRNIQNSQTPRNNVPKEKQQPTGPRVRPSDRESIQKMLANLPAKRATRKVLQENAARSQRRLRSVQSRAAAADNPASRIVKSKAVLRNKLLKNAKSFQRKKNLREEKQQENDARADAEERDDAEKNAEGAGLRTARTLSRNKSILSKENAIKHAEQSRCTINLRSAIVALSAADIIESSKKKAAPQPEKPVDLDPIGFKQRKKRIFDPLVSLNASTVKAKMQLRTNDGKFARNSVDSEKELIVPLDAKSVKIKRPINDSVRLFTRSKLRAAAKMAWKEHTKISRRITRLRVLETEKANIAALESSSSSASKEESTDKIANEGAGISKPKLLRTSSRNSSLSQRSLDGTAEDKSVDKSSEGAPLPAFLGRGRKPKRERLEARAVGVTNDESSMGKQQEQQLEVPSEIKTRSQKINANAAARLEPKVRRSISSKDTAADSPKKNPKVGSEVLALSPITSDKEKPGLITRSNSRTNKEKAETAGENASKKVPVSKEMIEKKWPKRFQKEVVDKKQTESELQTDTPAPVKKEKVLRKSLRIKEVDSKEASLNEILPTEDVLIVKNVSDRENKDATILTDEMKINEVIDKTQEDHESTPTKVITGKLRGRAKRLIESNENSKAVDIISVSEEVKKDGLEQSSEDKNDLVETSNDKSDLETASKDNSEQSEINSKFAEVAEKEPAPVKEQNINISGSTSLQNLSLEHLQQESSNSNMDSGKENSSEAIINVSKLKVVRPKKARGVRRDSKIAGTKRSLNSVIGILTEGVNVPSETQEPTIVLTVQTAIENDSSHSENACQSSEQPAIEISSISNEEGSKCEESNNAVNFGDMISNINEREKKNEKVVSIVENAKVEKLEISKPAEEYQKSTPPPDLEKEIKSYAPPPEQRANDIILDLTRRKPKGKGSFLEKIVSKIAKQKDVSLEGESTCNLDISHTSVDSQKSCADVKKVKTQECDSTIISKEINTESLLNKDACVKLSENKSVNIVNSTERATAVEVAIVIDKLATNSNINNASHLIEETLPFSLEINKDINNSAESNIVTQDNKILKDTTNKDDSETITDSKLKTLVTEEHDKDEKQKSRSKKRSLESNSPKKNKKKPVISENLTEEENEEEISLADIMKLIVRSRANEDQNLSNTDAKSEIVKPGKRKTPEDDTEFNSVYTNSELTCASITCKKEKETTRKCRRKDGQKDNESEMSESVEDFNSLIGAKVHENSDLELVKKNVALELTGNNDETAVTEESAINLGPNTEIIKEKEALISEDSESVNNDLVMEKSPNIEVDKQKEDLKIRFVDIQNKKILENDTPQKKKKGRKKVLKNNPERTENLDLEEYNSSIKLNESFKIPKSTKMKKRTSKRTSNLKNSSSEIESEKEEDNIFNKSVIDEKSDVSSDNIDQNSSMSESEEKITSKRVSKRIARISKSGVDGGLFANNKESDESDLSSANEMETFKRRRSLRNNTTLDSSRDVSISSVDENTSLMDSKPEKKRKKKSKRLALTSEHFELFTDNEISKEPEANAVEISNSQENIEENMKDNIEKTIEKDQNEDVINESLTVDISISENKINKTSENYILEKVESEIISEKVIETEQTEKTQKNNNLDDKVSATSESQVSFQDDTINASDKEETLLSHEMSTGEVDDCTNIDIQAPKKRSANFAVVTKSGKILIVEKKKKLTKEAAKFFCNVCTTSFTRKSSLKKHNLSQSHILQMTMNGDKMVNQNEDLNEDLTEPEEKEDDEEIEKDEEELNKECDAHLQKQEDKEKEVPDTLVTKEHNIIQQKELIEESVNLNNEENIVNMNKPVINSVLIIPEPTLAHKSSQEELEDEMLDEEICKITENMTHDEYVLTDHISPDVPEVSSSPVHQAKGGAVIPELDKKVKSKSNKKEKKKKNLADEHLDLDTPFPTEVVEPLTKVPSISSDVDNISIKDKSQENESGFNDEEDIEKPNQSVLELNESEKSIDEETLHNRKERRSRKNLEKIAVTSEIRRTGRNRNQNVALVIKVSENLRPKRNKLRPSYKEDENTDCDISGSPKGNNDAKKEPCKSQKDKSNLGIAEELHDLENSDIINKFRDSSTGKLDRSLDDIENTFSCPEKVKQYKKKNSEKFDLSCAENEPHNTVLQNNEEEMVRNGDIESITKSSLEKSENDSLEQELQDKKRKSIEKVNQSAKKKKGKKGKKSHLEKEESCVIQNVLVDNENSFIEKSEEIIENEKLSVVVEKQHRSKKNQNKKKKKNKLANKRIEKALKDNQSSEKSALIEQNLNADLKQRSEDKKTKSNIVLDSSFESSKTSFICKNEIAIPTLQVETPENLEISALPEAKSINDGHKQLPFPNLNTENFTSFEDTKNDLTASMLTGFDSDENSLDTNMSVDIQKLLDDPEMTTEIAKRPDEDSKATNSFLANIAPVDIMNIKEPSTRDFSKPAETMTEDKDQDKSRKSPVNNEFENAKVPKAKSVDEKKVKRRGKKSKNNNAKIANEASSFGEDSEVEEKQKENLEKSKNKIVKSVFGRVFAGERTDKVKEVLDDWQSRSEHNSSGSEDEKSTRKGRSRSKKSLRSSSGSKKSAESNGRSRQSKKRAEELISRAFNDDSPVPDSTCLVKNQRLSRRNQEKSPSPAKENQEDNDKLIADENCEDPKPITVKSKKARKRNSLEDLNMSTDGSKQAKYQKSSDDQQETIEKTEDFQISMLDQEQSHPSELEDTNNEVEEDEEGDMHISPLYSRNSSDNEGSLGSFSDSINEREQEKSVKRPKKKSRSSSRAFSGDKVVIRSPHSLSQHEDNDGPMEMVTIAPTDAIEDNALDLEMPIIERNLNPEKPSRQATKVLNFDEELFVECCSRLKATSEKELRGAKKIKLDHSADQVLSGGFYHQHYHRKDEQFGFKNTKDRWKDVESQNSLGSLLESVNQLLGEEYNSRDKAYSSATTKRGRIHGAHHHHHHHNRHHHHHHHHYHARHDGARSSRSASPEDGLLTHHRPIADEDNNGYDDSLDVAFEHNNKLRDKIQQRMRESENLIATSFGQRGGSPAAQASSHGYEAHEYEAGLHAKGRTGNGLGGLLNNLFHGNEKNDHNGSAPMKLLAELACARAPTSTTPIMPEKPTKTSPEEEVVESADDYKESHEHHHHHHHHHHEAKAATFKKAKNPIKELFERKKEQYEKRQLERMKVSKTGDKSRKQKKQKGVPHNQPSVRTGQFRGGFAERKKRAGSFLGKRKEQSEPSKAKIKDVYDFDDEESASEPGFSSILSYRLKADAPKVLSMSALLSKTIGETLTNGKTISAMGQNLESMVDRKFKDIEKYAPKTKASAKAPQTDGKQGQQKVIGPMDEFVERRQKSKRSSGDHSPTKHSGKSKKKNSKSAKKKARSAWYENDSSDEFVTKLKADDIGVGISKSQRTCSKGKQNLFAEMSSTSSESELERNADEENKDDFDAKEMDIASEPIVDKAVEESEEPAKNKENVINDESQNTENQEEKWPSVNNIHDSKSNSPIPDFENNKKSESELSDHPLVIDENMKEPDLEQRTNSDDETEERTFELDDLYREDSSIVDSDRDELSIVVGEEKSNSIVKAPESLPANSSDKKSTTDKYISLEDALELLDRSQDENTSPTTIKKNRFPPPVKLSNPESFEKNEKRYTEDPQDYEEGTTLDDLPEKLSSNQKPQRGSENLPLHIFLSRKVQESKKRKEQQLNKMKEDQERIFTDLQPTRRQRKCAIGKQGLLAEISSSDEELSESLNKKSGDKVEINEKMRSKQRQRESKEKRKERYIEKKHEQMIAKEQKAIEEAIMRELEEKRLSASSEASGSEKEEKQQLAPEEVIEAKEQLTKPIKRSKSSSKKRAPKKQSRDASGVTDNSNKTKKITSEEKITTNIETEVEEQKNSSEIEVPKVPVDKTPLKKRKPPAKSMPKGKKTSNETKKSKQSSNVSAAQRGTKNRSSSQSHGKDTKDQQRQRSLNNKRESDLDGDEELKATKSWKKVDEGVGVAIGRRKRAAANQLYYWSSSSDEEEKELVATPVNDSAVLNTGSSVVAQEGVEDDRQEQHGWIVGDSHKKMITMLAMEKQMKEKRRRSENDEQSPVPGAGLVGGKGKKKHRNSTS